MTSPCAHLGVLELLLYVLDECLALLADKRAEDEFGSDFTRPCDGTADTQQRTDLLCPQVADGGDSFEVVESDGELAGAQPGRGSTRAV